jgi:capsule polysaccharide export protein KpsE/RkpR
MKSSRITGIIIDKYNLKKEFKVKTKIDASRALEEITSIEVTPEGIISVSVTYKDKHLAVAIANSYIEELDTFNKEVAMTAGKKYRIFVEQRLEESTDSLARAEEALRNFQKNNLTVALEEEMVSVIQTVAELKSRIILLEVKKGALAASAQFDNPYLKEINKELVQLKSQLAKIEFGKEGQSTQEFGAGFSVPLAQLPDVYLEYLRLFRDVKIQEAIFELLTQQYEQARIMELKDTPTVQFLDRASPPEKRSFPRRTVIVVFAFVLSIVFNVFLAFTIEYVQDVKANPKSHKTFIKIVKDLSDDIQVLRKNIRRRFKRTKEPLP